MVTRDKDFGLPDEFADDVLDLVDQVPEGMVVTYGDLAEMLGRGGPRSVGRVMSHYGSDVPWWRVIRAGGYPPQGLEDEAVARWREEATPLVGGALGRRVDLELARWQGPEPQPGSPT
ncbi:MGMT family protein [Knoellia koreensis]|uniref:Cysteine methyltransferase n=1 Tax=Knoellia koreensis TaxID=2730921 RepID=A0A849H803_9MICO|nr:MGMT family protein [Knoellia sp. DB2414S]NNM45856.1 cysteine methyltransferase [Knoellia sp. DB2414S]